MTRLTLHNADTAPEAARPFIQQVISHNGFLPNLIGILANAPTALETYLTVSSINARSSLNLAEREVVQITAASINGCDFCVAGHTAIALKKAGLSIAQVKAMHEAQPTGNPRYDALATFARSLIAHRGHVQDADLQAFRAAGFSEAQSLEVLLGISLATLCNFANSLARSPINPQLAAFAPGALTAAA